MLEIITPTQELGPLTWEFLAKSLTYNDTVIDKALKKMIGFKIVQRPNKYYFYGELTEELNLQYLHQGAYLTKKISKNSVVFYTKQELLQMFCEQYEMYTGNKLELNINKYIVE